MPHPQRHKKSIKSDFPEVVAFASLLDELIKARTSENRLIRAAKVGKSKLCKYLDGSEVPDRRVLEHHILAPLATFAPLREGEREQLMGLYGQACAVCGPKEPTAKDQIIFLEEDLAQAQAQVDELTEQLNQALDKNLSDGQEKEEMEQGHKDLRALLKMMKGQVHSLEQELDQAKEEHKTSLEGADHKLAEFAEQLKTCQERISDLEMAVRHYAQSSDDLRRDMDRTLLRLHALHKQNALLHKQAAEERALFMQLVVHSAGGELLLRLNARLEQSEQTIAKLTETTRDLVTTNQALAADLDRVTQERDFLRAAPTNGLSWQAPNPAGDTTPLPELFQPFPDDWAPPYDTTAEGS